MRIISKHNDYYDGAQAMGQDRSLVYLRMNASYDVSRDPMSRELAQLVQGFKECAWRPPLQLTKSWRDRVDLQPYLLLVAGKLYPQVSVRYPLDFSRPEKRPSIVETLEEVSELYERYDGMMLEHNRKRVANWETFFAQRGSDRLAGLATAAGTPAVLYRTGRLEVNPVLADREFYRTMDAWTVFQEISMFMGNLANPDNTPINISDKDRIAQHGFDEYSFRKPPQKVR